MGLFGGGGGSSHTRYKVPKEFRGVFNDFLGETNEAARQIEALGAYQGPWVAGIQPTQTEALGGLENLARMRMENNPGSQLVSAAQRYFSPEYLNIGSDPIFTNALMASLTPLEQSRVDQLNRVRAVAAGSGADLGDRAFISEQATNEGIDRTISDMVAQMTLSELGRREQLQTTSAPQFLAGAYGLEETPARLLGEVGDIRRQYEQETVVDPAKAQFEEELQSILRGQIPYQGFLGTTGLPFNSRNSGGGGGGGGLGSILSLLLGVGGLLTA